MTVGVVLQNGNVLISSFAFITVTVFDFCFQFSAQLLMPMSLSSNWNIPPENWSLQFPAVYLNSLLSLSRVCHVLATCLSV